MTTGDCTGPDHMTAWLTDEITLYGQLVDLLSEEHQVLLQGDVETLNRVTPQKSACVAKIEAVDRQRAGSPQPPQTSHPGLWQQLSDLASLASKQNQANGKMINLRLQRTQEALSILRDDSDQSSTYGRDGHTRMPGKGRPLSSA